MSEVALTEGDVIQHIVTFGIDVYPPVEIPKERTRLNIFYEEARSRHGDLFDQLVASDTTFRISREFRPQGPLGDPALRQETFALTNRGPVFIFPVRFPDPVGATGINEDPRERFETVRRLFFSAIAERKIMRIGMVRDLIFDTGEDPCRSVLSGKAEFAGAQLVGGSRLLSYRDAYCNLRIAVEPGAMLKTTKLPVGTEVTERRSYGLRVQLDVYNLQVKPLEDADIQQVLERATSLWPEKLLQYLQERS